MSKKTLHLFILAIFFIKARLSSRPKPRLSYMT